VLRFRLTGVIDEYGLEATINRCHSVRAASAYQITFTAN
jgi:hypothetical protein